MEMLAKQFIGKECLVYTVTDTMGSIQGTVKEVTGGGLILECSDGSFYTGWTNNLERRVKAHNAGKGAKYTKSRKPVKLVYFETFLTKQEAMRREWEIKQLSRVEKWKMIQAKKQ